MRKKLLALLMCATMVLGTAATLKEDNYKAADTIIKQFGYFNGEFNDGEFGKETSKKVNFVTNYEHTTGTQAQYKYVFVDGNIGGNDITNYVKADKDNNPFVKVGTDAFELEATVDSTTVTGVKQLVFSAADYAKVTGKKTLVKAVDGGATHYYYVSAAKSNLAATDANAESVKDQTIAVNTVVTNPSVTADMKLVNADRAKVLSVTEYNPADKTSIYEFIPTAGAPLQDGYGLDVDGYIPVKSGEKAVQLYTTLNKDYYVSATKAEADKVDIANAYAEGLISKDAVAVNLKFYKLESAGVPVLGYVDGSAQVANQNTMMKLRYAQASREDVAVSLKMDWLTRTNLKKASGVSAFILDKFVPTTANTFSRVGTLVKVADIDSETFTADYLISGTYIFDVASAASNNDGVADTTTAAAANNSSSPKTGDVAPIAALAVVMMGACGAMVVASKKRA